MRLWLVWDHEACDVLDTPPELVSIHMSKDGANRVAEAHNAEENPDKDFGYKNDYRVESVKVLP